MSYIFSGEIGWERSAAQTDDPDEDEDPFGPAWSTDVLGFHGMNNY